MNQSLNLLLQTWLWDCLYTLDAQNKFIQIDGFEQTQIAQFIQADTWFDEENPYNPIVAREKIKQAALAWFEKYDFEELWQMGIPNILRENVKKWEQLFHLNQVETKLLTFVVLLHHQTLLTRITYLLEELDDESTIRVLATLLRLPENEVADALRYNATLSNVGILKIDSNSDYPLRSKLDLLSSKFAHLMMQGSSSPVSMLKEHIQAAPTTQLTLDDFTHLGDLNAATLDYLKYVFAHKQKGCNILIHGMAGVGKTEYTRALSQAVGVELFEITWEDADGDPAERSNRLNALRMAQRILSGQNIMLMFDEVEDVFDRQQQRFSLNKAWLNRHLENNLVPTVWICNHVHLIDPSVIRRFDIVIEMKSPPLSKRTQLIGQYTSEFYSQAQIQGLAENDALVPAILKQAHKVIHNLPQHWQPENKGKVFHTLLKNTLQAQGEFKPLNMHSKLPEIYNLDWVNSKQNLHDIAQGLIRTHRGTVCLYGAAGTGKSAYAAWIAQQADKRLIYKRASDLLNKYIGETEQSIAAAFTEAQEENAVLVFDEVDSFLQDRRGANHSWEVSQVNEMLTQMEAFNGIFIASTNLLGNLDQAALRRFDFKIEFSYLRTEQIWAMFGAYAAQMGLTVPPSLKADVIRLKNVAAGDFAVLAKQARITPFVDAQSLFRALQTECAMKEGAKATMGFF